MDRQGKWFWIAVVAALIIAPPVMCYIGYRIGQGWL